MNHNAAIFSPQLAKLPINDISIASTKEVESLLDEARTKCPVAEVEAAKEELQILHRKANQYLTTIMGLPKVHTEKIFYNSVSIFWQM